jgi:hypothetical protein
MNLKYAEFTAHKKNKEKAIFKMLFFVPSIKHFWQFYDQVNILLDIFFQLLD